MRLLLHARQRAGSVPSVALRPILSAPAEPPAGVPAATTADPTVPLANQHSESNPLLSPSALSPSAWKKQARQRGGGRQTGSSRDLRRGQLWGVISRVRSSASVLPAIEAWRMAGGVLDKELLLWVSAVQCGVMWCSVVWCGVVRLAVFVCLSCGNASVLPAVEAWRTGGGVLDKELLLWVSAVQCGVMWCSVVWCGVVRLAVFVCLSCGNASVLPAVEAWRTGGGVLDKELLLWVSALHASVLPAIEAWRMAGGVLDKELLQWVSAVQCGTVQCVVGRCGVVRCGAVWVCDHCGATPLSCRLLRRGGWREA
ncbi:unnamed protein product [Closterium sp. Yama58-4]|nr:unnamed protein product [Closterium sp. Yama58-4]